MTATYTLGSQERIKSQKAIDALFAGGKSQSLSAFPLRLVYLETSCLPSEPQAQVMVSVSKRYFKRAVKRNRIKRQIREAYRLNKAVLTEPLTRQPGRAVLLAFLWQTDRLMPTAEVETHMKTLLHRLAERL